MKSTEIFNAVTKIDEQLIEGSLSPRKSRKIPVRVKLLVSAACLVIVAVTGIGAFAVAAEAKEYRTALAFFNENGLSTEGLSRSDIKAVYRDITTETYALDVTAKVTAKKVPGLNIQTDAAKTDGKSSYGKISYKTDSTYAQDKEKGFEVFEKCAVECYTDGELLWRTEVSDFPVSGYKSVGNGTVIWGDEAVYTPADDSSWKVDSFAWAGFIDKNGTLLWTYRFEHGFDSEYSKSVLTNADGSFAIFTFGLDKENSCNLCFSRLSADGEEILSRITELEEDSYVGEWNTANIGSEYLVRAGSSEKHNKSHLLKIDGEGNVSDDFAFKAEDCEYAVTDMIEFGGNVYLSAYAFPIRENEGSRHEISDILEYVDKNGQNLTEESLTSVVRANYTAVLLICDSNAKQPQIFYSVQGALSDTLSEGSDNRLEWSVNSISSASYSPLTSAYSVIIDCNVLRCTFNEAGELTEQINSGEESRILR